MVTMKCSCGAMMEHADDPVLTVSIEARKWREDHAACASRVERVITTEEPCPSCAALRGEVERLRERDDVWREKKKMLENNLATAWAEIKTLKQQVATLRPVAERKLKKGDRIHGKR